jgi:spermidine/putrescine transport system permease protein
MLYLWLIVFALLPLLMTLGISFFSNSSTKLIELPLTLEHYLSLFTPTFAKIFLRSILIAGLTTLFCLALAYPFSYLLVKSKYQSTLLLLIIIPFWTSSLVRTYALIAILKFKGILNTLLLYFHLIDSPISLLYSNFAVFLGLVYNLFPFMVLPIFSNMERFDFRLLEAAADLGASKLDIFLKVFLPSTAPGIIAGCLLVFLPTMTFFYIPNVLGGARSVLLGNVIQEEFLVLNHWPQGAATSIVLTLILCLLMIFFRQKNAQELNP